MGSPLPSSPVLSGSSVVIAVEEGLIYALNTGNNMVKRIADLQEKVYAALVTYQGMVYAHTEKGNVYGVDALTGAIRQMYSIKK